MNKGTADPRTCGGERGRSVPRAGAGPGASCVTGAFRALVLPWPRGPVGRKLWWPSGLPFLQDINIQAPCERPRPEGEGGTRPQAIRPPEPSRAPPRPALRKAPRGCWWSILLYFPAVWGCGLGQNWGWRLSASGSPAFACRDGEDVPTCSPSGPGVGGRRLSRPHGDSLATRGMPGPRGARHAQPCASFVHASPAACVPRETLRHRGPLRAPRPAESGTCVPCMGIRAASTRLQGCEVSGCSGPPSWRTSCCWETQGSQLCRKDPESLP